jgi:hypothetical protein
MAITILRLALFISSVLQCLICSIRSQTPYITWLEDKIALRSIFQDCDGNNWRETWGNLNLDPCIYSEHYPGISCDLALSTDFLRSGWYYRVSQINLNSNKLICKKLDFAGQTLKLLKVLDITLASGITENTIETIISKAPNLEVLKLSGVLPYTNKTNRMIPPSLCTLDQLRILFLNDNCYGSIPSCFHYDSFPKLSLIDLTSNKLSNLSNSFHTLNLTSLYLKNNNLGQLHLDKNNLVINNNIISSRENATNLNTMKQIFWYMPYLQKLDLSYNKFEKIDVSMCASTIPNIDLSNNIINEIPKCSNANAGNSYINILNLAHNKITSIENFDNFTSIINLDVSNNKMAKEPCYPASSFSQLEKLDCSYNNFNAYDEKNISINYFNRLGKQLVSLRLDSCNFKGTLAAFSNLNVVTSLSLSNNNFYGSIRPLAILNELVHLDISFNKLSAKIIDFGGPISYNKNPSRNNIEILKLNNNEFVGDIPFEHLFKLPNLKQIDISYNVNLQGKLPSTLKPSSIFLETIQLDGVSKISGPSSLVKSSSSILRLSNASKLVFTLSNLIQYECSDLFYNNAAKTNLIVMPRVFRHQHCVCLKSIGFPPDCLPCPNGASCNDGVAECMPGFYFDSVSGT